MISDVVTAEYMQTICYNMYGCKWAWGHGEKPFDFFSDVLAFDFLVLRELN